MPAKGRKQEITADQVDELLLEVDVAIEAAQKVNLLGDDPATDPVLKKIQQSRDGLELEWSDFQKEVNSRPKTKTRTNLMKTVRVRYLELQDELQILPKFIARRSAKNKLGLFNSLVERQVLLASHKAYPLKGRFENTGPALYIIATNLVRVAKQLKELYLVPSQWTDNQIDGWVAFERNATLVINSIIKFMVDAPFQIEDHEGVLGKIKREVDILMEFAFDGVVAKESVGMMSRLVTMQADLEVKQKDFGDRARKFASEQQYRTSVEERELAHFGLGPGDLNETRLVVTRMTSRSTPSMKGCGLSIICTGKTPTIQHRQGGYAVVLKKLLPETCVLSLEVPGRLVAVKLSKGKNDSIAMSNLRTFREAARWAAVCSETRGMTEANGGQYLAPLLGLWGEIEEGRPGLVSVWCDQCHLGQYLREFRPPTLTRLTILAKIAKGVQFLHSCEETIIHGDLKPSNVLMLDGDPLITDFGLSKCLEEKKGFSTSGNCYSDGFRAPELELEYRDKSLVPYPTTKSDVYAFACVMFEALSDKEIYEGHTNIQKKEWIKSEQDYTPVDIEFKRKEENRYPFEYPHLELLVNCLRFHASKRPAMEEVVAALENYKKFQMKRSPPLVT